jgi:hypothetical protein
MNALQLTSDDLMKVASIKIAAINEISRRRREVSSPTKKKESAADDNQWLADELNQLLPPSCAPMTGEQVLRLRATQDHAERFDLHQFRYTSAKLKSPAARPPAAPAPVDVQKEIRALWKNPPSSSPTAIQRRALARISSGRS